MTRQIFASALFAGLMAAIVATLLQVWLLAPLILEAERYERGEVVHFAGVHGKTVAAPAMDAAAMPAETPVSLVERDLMTLSMNLVIFTGYGLVLAALFALSEAAGRLVGPLSGALWGLAAFAALNLAPAVTLPPELPGIPAADLAGRQVWWVLTVAATGLGLAAIFLRPAPLTIAAGVGLILLPHVIGAPKLAEFGGIVAPELSAEFAARSLAVAAVQMMTLGAALALAFNRLGARHPAPA